MARPTVYLETSVVSYAISRMSRDLVLAARQETTREWFESTAPSYDLHVSQLVLIEATAGDAEAAHQRLSLLRGIPILAVTDEAGELARRFIDSGVIPATSVEDAIHIAVATVHGMNYLLTWNYRHIARASLRTGIERACRDAGYEPPVICTPEELTDED